MLTFFLSASSTPRSSPSLLTSTMAYSPNFSRDSRHGSSMGSVAYITCHIHKVLVASLKAVARLGCGQVSQALMRRQCKDTRISVLVSSLWFYAGMYNTIPAARPSSCNFDN